MASGQRLLDAILARQEPVQRVVQVILGGVDDVEFLGQRGDVPPARRGQLALRLQDARGDHPQDQAPLARRPRVEEATHAHALHRRHDGLDVAVLGRGDNLEELLGGGEALALQGAPNECNDVGGQVGEVADGLVLDLAVLAITAPQQVSGVGLVLVVPPCRDDVHCATRSCHAKSSRPSSADSR